MKIMRLTKEEFQRTTHESPYQLFLEGIKAKETQAKYSRTLKRILCHILEEFLEGTFEQRAAQLVKLAKQDPDYSQDLLIGVSKKLKERTVLPKQDKNYLNPDTVPNYFKPIKKLFDMNNVPYSWKRIYATFPEIDNRSDTRGWKRQEIQTMLKFANGAIDRAVILIAASSGIRLGGFSLNWDDIVPIYKIGNDLSTDITESQVEQAEIVCAMLKIYSKSSESYPAFITPEAYHALIDYRNEWCKEVGRDPTPEEPIFKKEGNLPIIANPPALKKRIERILENAGLRKPLPVGQKRYEVPVMNGFRRFWNKTCKESLSRDSPLASLIKKEFMMGHTGLVRLDRNYFKTQVLELAEEYQNAIPDLTISDEERAKTENQKLKKERNTLKIKEKEIQNLKDSDAVKTEVIGNISDQLLDLRKEIKELKKVRS